MSAGRYRHGLVGTEKRERQKANRAKRQEEQAKAARASAVKRNVVRWVIVAVAALGAVVLIAWIGGAFDGDDDETPTTTIAAVTLPAEITTPDTAPADTTAVTTATTAAP